MVGMLTLCVDKTYLVTLQQGLQCGGGVDTACRQAILDHFTAMFTVGQGC